MEFFQLFIIAIVLVALCFAGLAIKIIVSKRGRFPNIHIGNNRALKERGITCIQAYDKMEQAKVRKEYKFKNVSLANDELHVNC
ncbi:MAG: hypothetical protein AB2L24_29190 [Mangrovibacterium sp.]